MRQEAFTWANVDPDTCCHMSSLGHNELKASIMSKNYFMLFYFIITKCLLNGMKKIEKVIPGMLYRKVLYNAWILTSQMCTMPVMACFPMVPSHYLNQFEFLIVRFCGLSQQFWIIFHMTKLLYSLSYFTKIWWNGFNWGTRVLVLCRRGEKSLLESLQIHWFGFHWASVN